MTSVFDLLVEPRFEVYRALIDAGARVCERALLVVRSSDGLEESGRQFLSELDPFLLHSSKAPSWPGTVLYAGTALVYEYHLDPELVKRIGERVDGLYDWLHPKLPEDLCLLRADGQEWLGSIAHERDGWLRLSESEYIRLTASFPSLQRLLRAAGERS